MSIYKDCDIRGIFNEDLEGETAYHIGRSIGTIMQNKTLVVGGDVRISTPLLKEKLIDGLMDSGAKIIDIGTVPTPVFYFAKGYLKADGGVAVTASHNPAKYNGFKIILSDMPIQTEDIQNIKKIVDRHAYRDAVGSYQSIEVNDAYKEYIKGLVKVYRSLKVVIDAGNGTTSIIAPQLFRNLGYTVIPLFCEYDGSFPYREPNPAIYSNLSKLQSKVLEEGADLGIAFDGDGDRVVFVDEKGRISASEESFTVFIQEYLKDKPSPVIYDIKSSSIVEKEVEKYHGKPIMERSGHAFIKKTFLENHAVLAGEISGHFFFRELGYDDGIFAALKMAEILTKNNKKLSYYTDRIEKTVMTPDLRIPYPKDCQLELLEKVESLNQQYEITKLDGIRVQFPNGWALIRQSVTEPCITIRFEADSETDLDFIKKEFLKTVPELYGKHELLL
ncbi:phosphomannomutase/phosphoglucomutase [Geosporobacter ferrireducens]|uniref:phosphomannomutase/phosphoglucomutase n=1 Tax=Geosporobacter ferrireducens TaxID=1424294 RepID=UPI00147151B5|nr:phosphomannomutase/phosphoglucomutase [Geosporobacter ferrireducens]